MTPVRVAAIALGLVGSLMGCVVIPYKPPAETRHEAAAIAQPELVRLSVGPRKFLDKMARGVLRESKELQRVEGQAFLDAASPDGELTLARLLEQATRERIAPLGIDYVVILGEPKDELLEEKGGMIPLLGAAKTKSSSSYWAAVVDLREMKLFDQLTSESIGTDVGAAFFYGLFVVSRPGASARDNLIQEVAGAIARAKPAGSVRVAFLAVE